MITSLLCFSITSIRALALSAEASSILVGSLKHIGRKRGEPCQNVIVKNNTVLHGHGGFVVGSEMSGGVKNIYGHVEFLRIHIFHVTHQVVAGFLDYSHPVFGDAQLCVSCRSISGVTFSGRICGKKSTSWIKDSPVINMVRRSMPIPMPDVGGIPYCNACLLYTSWTKILADIATLTPPCSTWHVKRR